MKISTWKGAFLLLVLENIISGHKKSGINYHEKQKI